MKLWDVSSGAEIRTFKGHSSFVESVAFSPDGRYVFSGSYDRTLKVWNSGIKTTIKIGLNQSRYKKTEPVRIDLLVNGQAIADLYVAMILPNKSFITFAYPSVPSWPNQAQIYQAKVKIAGQQSYPVNINLPSSAKSGQYSACGVLVKAGASALKTANWIDFHCAGFEVY